MVPVVDLPDVYIDGIGAIEVIGENVRFIFYRLRPTADHKLEQEPVFAIVRPLITLPDAIAHMEDFLMHLPVPRPEYAVKRVGH